MVGAKLSSVDLCALVEAHFEWLLVHENGRVFPLRKNEIEVSDRNGKLFFEFLDHGGYRTVRVKSFALEDGQISLEVRSQIRKDSEHIHLIPRASARELNQNIELARLERANEIGRLIEESLAGTKVARIALNAENGRLAQIACETPEHRQAVVLCDVTETVGPELLLTTACLVLRELQDRRNKPVAEAWLVCETKQARNLQKLHALLNEREKGRFRIFEVRRKREPHVIRERRKLRLSQLWREKPKKLVLPPNLESSDLGRRITSLALENVDLVFSKQGETLRYLGLPFARVRRMPGGEKAWFGIDTNRQLVDKNWTELEELVQEIGVHRSAQTHSKRHEVYRCAPEAWLESILRRNIQLLDSNLILSPLYNQFRSARDKIDLLAIRKDGRIVILELKTSPDRETVFQAADYWRKIELQRRSGQLQRVGAFPGIEILDKPVLVYVVAPALSFHRDFDYFAKMLAREIELWRFELHENWRTEIKVIARKNVNEPK